MHSAVQGCARTPTVAAGSTHHCCPMNACAVAPPQAARRAGPVQAVRMLAARAQLAGACLAAEGRRQVRFLRRHVQLADFCGRTLRTHVPIQSPLFVGGANRGHRSNRRYAPLLRHLRNRLGWYRRQYSFYLHKRSRSPNPSSFLPCTRPVSNSMSSIHYDSNRANWTLFAQGVALAPPP